MSVRVLLVDDHQMMRDGLRAILGRRTDFEVIGEAEDGRSALSQATQLQPDVVERMKWLDQDIHEQGARYYVRLETEHVDLFLKKGSPHIRWDELACSDDVCRLRSAAGRAAAEKERV